MHLSFYLINPYTWTVCRGCSRISAELKFHSLALELYAGLVLHWIRLYNDLVDVITQSDV